MNDAMDNKCSDILTELETWYGRDSGRYLSAAVAESVADILPTAFGYHLLQLSALRNQVLFDSTAINHRVYCSPRAGAKVGLIAAADEVPLESDSIDVLILHHALEFNRNPHQVLREAQRVLAPQGCLIVVAFNPYSLYGAAHRIQAWLGNSLWQSCQGVGEPRLRDWLNLLGFEICDARNLYTLPAFARGSAHSYLQKADRQLNKLSLPVGGLYAVHAIKRAAGLNKPRRAQRDRSARLIDLAVPKPAAAPGSTANRPDKIPATARLPQQR